MRRVNSPEGEEQSALSGLVFVRHRNIWVLALGQALISTVIFVSLPDAWHHRLRVGPGFFWWPVR